MKTFKKLGLKMWRESATEWLVQGARVSYKGAGNKGTVMSDALHCWQERGEVTFSKERGWNYANQK